MECYVVLSENESVSHGADASALALSSEKDEGVVGRRGTQIKTSDSIADTPILPMEADLGGEDAYFEEGLVQSWFLVLSIHYAQRNQFYSHLKCIHVSL